MKLLAGGFVCEIPLTWGDMTEKIKVVNLDKQSNEYTDIAARFSQSTGIYSCTVEKVTLIKKTNYMNISNENSTPKYVRCRFQSNYSRNYHSCTKFLLPVLNWKSKADSIARS